MKTPLLIILLTILFSFNANAQSNRVYIIQEITWFGLDYSEAFFIDNKAFPDPYKLKHGYFQRWNDLVFLEKNKFDIAKTFNKRDITYSTEYINSRNNTVDIFDKIINNRFHQSLFNIDSIQEIVSSYQIDKSEDGIGLVFIVESLNKLNHEALYWVTFFDLKTKKVLLTERIAGRPSGAGIHNYWANSFYTCLITAEQELGFTF